MLASERWQQLVIARAEAAGRRRPAECVGGAFWDRRASALAAATAHDDPLLERVLPHVDRESRVLDVGSGPGRFALELAPRVAEVVAVDPSREVLRILKERSQERGITNIRCIPAHWEEADVEAGDVTICAHVLPFIEQAGSFLERLDSFSQRRVFVYMNALGAETPDPFWRHFHGSPLPPSPTYLDALDVLRELGIEPDIEVVELPRRVRYETLAEAVSAYRENLGVPGGDGETDELASLLRSWLVRDGDAWRSPVPALPAAIVSWEPRQRSARPSFARPRRERRG